MTDIALLIKRHLKDELNEEERTKLEAWIEQSAVNRRIFETLTDDDYILKAVGDAYKIDSDEVAQQKINALIDAGQQAPGQTVGATIKKIWPRLAVAAAILVVFAITTVYMLKKNEKPEAELAKTENTKQDIAPGTYKATLTLADGRSIILDSATAGQLAQQGSTQVMNKDGQLVYEPAGKAQKGEVLWNRLSTGRGQTYPLLLSDGSRVTLNSESSISFPVAFTGDVREVKVAGEVFFEVVHDASKPFKVKAGDMELQVLGTSFNVNAYADENAVKATLVEGSVQVKKGVQKKIIKPGQQAQVLRDEITITEVDVDKITAWKQGLFRFKEDKLSEAMKNIARWYNVDVMFEGNAANVDVSGNISRSANLSELIKLLAIIDVQARIEGRKLILKAE
jgi:transmembrane sensor